MKILITGSNSYIGNAFMNWLKQWPDQYEIHSISVRGHEWEGKDFSVYDSVLHVAGIAHVSSDPKMEDLYYQVNRDLAIKVAEKSKKDGVTQFVLMSSIIIYGDDNKIGVEKSITEETTPRPTNFYGKSKLESDLAIQKMNCESFKTVIVRTPMVYGPGCKGNFPKLRDISRWCIAFPNIDNKRSMIYIDNLCEFLKLQIDNISDGVFYPQNREYVATKDIIKTFRDIENKRTYCVNLFNPIVRLLSKKIKYINKIFGNKYYDKSISNVHEYNVVDFKESIERSS